VDLGLSRLVLSPEEMSDTLSPLAGAGVVVCLMG
jgi:hypothetical protein